MSRHNVPEDDSLWPPHGTAADLSRCRGRCENRLSIISFRIKWYARPIEVAFPLLVRQLDTSHNASVLGDFARGSETTLKQNPSESAPALGSMWFNGKGNPSPHGLWLHDCYWAAWSNMRPKQMATFNDWSILLGVEFMVRGRSCTGRWINRGPTFLGPGQACVRGTGGRFCSICGLFSTCCALSRTTTENIPHTGTLTHACRTYHSFITACPYVTLYS